MPMAQEQPPPSHQPQWQSIRDCKLADIASHFPREWQIPFSQLPPPTQTNVLDVPRTCGILTPREIHITEDYNARELANAICERRFTAVEVTTAFCKRATISHQLTACLTEPLFSSAISRAEYLDAHLARTGSPLGPLHGLPISVKDSFWVKGIDSSIGIASLCNKPASKNATIVDILLGAGAVIHCKTNVPQTLMALDSINNIFGRTLNPLNRHDWTAGGSSGGEGVLVKMRGSVLGVGTDVGGSVRIPAMCNGIYGLKPSLGRIPGEGQTGSQLEAAGKVGMESVVGPIAREVGDIGLFMEVVEGAEAWKVEAGVVPGKWWSSSSGDVQGKKKNMLIGVVASDGVTSPLPPVRRMLSDTVRLLQNAGVEVINLPAPHFKDCQSLSNKFFNAEGGAHTFSLLAQTGEPLIPWLEGRFKQKTPATVDKLRDLQAQKIQLQNEFLSVWKTDDGRDIDAFICPVAPHPVPGIDRWNTVSYTAAFVLLDYPAAVVPVRSVTRADLEEEMEEEMEEEGLGGWDKINRGLWDGKTVDREAYLGSPLCVQVVGPRLQERRVWEVCGVIEEAVWGMGKGMGARL